MKRHLDCHTTGKMAESGNVFAIEGKSYEIIKESEWAFIIQDELDERHAFSKIARSDEGTSYKTWFNLVDSQNSGGTMEKYTLSKTETRDIFIVKIVADSNDADYITEERAYSKADFDEYVADALIDLLANYSDDHQLPDYPNKFDLSIPYNGWDGSCHTLESVTIKHIDANGEHWNVELIIPESNEDDEDVEDNIKK